MNKNQKTRRNFIKSMGLTTAALTIPAFFPKCKKQNFNHRPNVLVIYTDDVNEYQLGCYGGNVYTPHVDSLADEGVRFTRAYVTTSICTPSRYGLITGQFPGRCSHPRFQKEFPNGVQTEVRFNTPVNPEALNLAKVMKAAGYRTGCVGKWDFGTPSFEELGEEFLEPYPRSDGWTKATNEADPADPAVSALLKRNHDRLCNYAKRLGFDYADALYRLNMEFWSHALNIHNMEWVTDAALRFIDENKNQPFFLYMAPTLHHIPHPQESMLQADPRITMGGYLEKAPAVQPPRKGIIPRVQEAGFPAESAYCTWLDDGVGAVINRLKKYGLYNDTIIVFMSDHQSPDKCSLYEAGVKTPCMIRYPKVTPKGNICDELIQNTDIVPTMFDMCGISKPSEMHLDGKSIAPMMRSEKKSTHESLYFEYGWTRAVCTKRWKYLALRYSKAAEKLRKQKKRRLYHDKQLEPMQHNVLLHHPNYWDPDQLYDLTIDVEETTNFAYDPKYAGILKEMKDRLRGYLESFGDHPFGEFLDE